MQANSKPFWSTKKLHELTASEWEALCDGCAKCCVHKLEDKKTGIVYYTRIACRLLDIETCRCMDYKNHHTLVPECAILSAKHTDMLSWMPETCAYRRLHEGRPLPDWHPLITGTPDSVRPHRVSANVHLIPEQFVDPNTYTQYVIEEENKPSAE